MTETLTATRVLRQPYRVGFLGGDPWVDVIVEDDDQVQVDRMDCWLCYDDCDDECEERMPESVADRLLFEQGYERVSPWTQDDVDGLEFSCDVVKTI